MGKGVRRERTWILLGVVCGLSWSCAVDGEAPDDDEDGVVEEDGFVEERVDEGIDEEFDVGVGVAEIRGGRARNDHPEIGQMFQNINDRDRWYSCTATLVDRRIAVTAGHCVEHKNQDRAGNYGFLEIKTPTSSGSLRTYRYTINGYHNFDGWPHNYTGDPDDIGLIRLSKAVPCSVAKPARRG
jgi:hypothetical protein